MGQRGLQHRRRLGRGGLLGPHTESKLGASQCNEHHRSVTSAALTSASCVQLTAFQHGLPFGLFTRPGPISAMASCTLFRHGADIIQVMCTQSFPLCVSYSFAVNPTIWTTAHTTQVPCSPHPNRPLSTFFTCAVCFTGLAFPRGFRTRHASSRGLLGCLRPPSEPCAVICSASCRQREIRF
jgi:hypothetical protein